jgi:DNA-binding XRE family transcriptional regulator
MIGEHLKRRREALGITREEMGKMIRASERVVAAYEANSETYPLSAARASEHMERIEQSRAAGKISGIEIRLERARKGYTSYDLSALTGFSVTSLVHLEGQNVGSQEMIDAVFAALGMEGAERFDKATCVMPEKLTRSTRGKRLRHRDTTAEDEREARLLGISYGTYMSYKETGYLETFREQQAAALHRDDGKNIIESSIIGAGAAGRRIVASVGSSKMG